MTGKWEASGVIEHSKIVTGGLIGCSQNACDATQHTQTQNKSLFKNKQFRDESRTRQIHQSIQ